MGVKAWFSGIFSRFWECLACDMDSMGFMDCMGSLAYLLSLDCRKEQRNLETGG